MTLQIVLVLAVALMVLVRVYFASRRKAIRQELLRSGTRAPGRVVTVPGRGDAVHQRDSGVIVVAYRTADGVDRQVFKLPQKRGDSWLAGEPAAVLYDPRRPADTERVLVGFGRTEKRWFRAKQRPLPTAKKRG